MIPQGKYWNIHLNDIAQKLLKVIPQGKNQEFPHFPGGSVPSDEWFSLKLNIYSKTANKVDIIDFYNFQLNYDIAFCNVMHEMIMIFI